MFTTYFSQVEAFRHFDADGNGTISRAELEQGLNQLGIFNNVNASNMRHEVPKLFAKIDLDGNGEVSLKEFLAFLGITDYAPNIVQRMTKVFSVAADKGLSFKEIFSVFDADGNGTIDASELRNILLKVGNFGDISMEDAEMVVKIFNTEVGGSLSLTAFSSFFESRVHQATLDRQKKKEKHFIYKFCSLLRVAESKGTSMAALFNHMDSDHGGSISVDELIVSLRALPHFAGMADADIQRLVKAVDTDNSGEISFEELKTFVDDHSPPLVDAAYSSASSASVEDVLQRIRMVFRSAEEQGLTVEKAFSHLDRDGNSEISISEMHSALLKIPHFKSLQPDDVAHFMGLIDADRNGTISIKEFESFLHDSEGDRKNTKSLIEKFSEHFRIISEKDGGVASLLAFLDDDEDGIISKVALFRLLTRENLFEDMTKAEVDSVLAPACRNGNEDDINVVELLHIIENTSEDQRLSYTMNIDHNEFNNSNAGVDPPPVDYDFSTDPETRSMEKRLRGLGRALAKKGVDVEGFFRSHDIRNTGTVRRTELLEVLSQLGLCILETGKVVDHINNDSLGGARSLQVQQMRKIHGVDHGYSHNAARTARMLLTDPDSAVYGKQKLSSDFKVILQISLITVILFLIFEISSLTIGPFILSGTFGGNGAGRLVPAEPEEGAVAEGALPFAGR